MRYELYLQLLKFVLSLKDSANFLFSRFPNSKKPEEAVGKNLVDTIGDQSPKTSSRIVHDSTKSEPEKVRVTTFKTLNAVILLGTGNHPPPGQSSVTKHATNEKTLQVGQLHNVAIVNSSHFSACRTITFVSL